MTRGVDPVGIQSPNQGSVKFENPGARHGSLSSTDSLGHKVAERRRDLGISVEELADRTGIDPRYLRYLEDNVDASLSAGAILLVAHALDTDAIVLEGEGTGHINQPSAGVPRPILKALTHEQCEAHLSVGGVGRILLVSGRGPIALPVNFAFADGHVVFSTDKAKAKRIESEHLVGFQIDRVDSSMGEGWSVLVTGRARRLGQGDNDRLASTDISSWVESDRSTLVAIAADEITGRVIVHESPAP